MLESLASPHACFMNVYDSSSASYVVACGSLIVVASERGACTSVVALPNELGAVAGPLSLAAVTLHDTLLVTTSGAVLGVDLNNGRSRVVCQTSSRVDMAALFNDALFVSCADNAAPCLISRAKRVTLALRHSPVTAIYADGYAAQRTLYNFRDEAIASLHEPVDHLVALSALVLCVLASGALCIVDPHARAVLSSADGVGPVAAVDERDGAVALLTRDGLVYACADALAQPLELVRVCVPARARAVRCIAGGVAVLTCRGAVLRCSAPTAPSDVDAALERLRRFAEEQADIEAQASAVDARLRMAAAALRVKWGRETLAECVVNVFEEAPGAGRWGKPFAGGPSQRHSIALMPLAAAAAASGSALLAVAMAPCERVDVLSSASALPSRLPADPCALALRVVSLSRALATHGGAMTTAADLLQRVVGAGWKVARVTPARAVASGGQCRVTLEFDHLDGAVVSVAAPNAACAALVREALLARLGGDEDEVEGAKRGRRSRDDDCNVLRAVLDARDALCAGEFKAAVAKTVTAWKMARQHA